MDHRTGVRVFALLLFTTLFWVPSSDQQSIQINRVAAQDDQNPGEPTIDFVASFIDQNENDLFDTLLIDLRTQSEQNGDIAGFVSIESTDSQLLFFDILSSWLRTGSQERTVYFSGISLYDTNYTGNVLITVSFSISTYDGQTFAKIATQEMMNLNFEDFEPTLVNLSLEPTNILFIDLDADGLIDLVDVPVDIMSTYRVEMSFRWTIKYLDNSMSDLERLQWPFDQDATFFNGQGLYTISIAGERFHIDKQPKELLIWGVGRFEGDYPLDQFRDKITTPIRLILDLEGISFERNMFEINPIPTSIILQDNDDNGKIENLQLVFEVNVSSDINVDFVVVVRPSIWEPYFVSNILFIDLDVPSNSNSLTLNISHNSIYNFYFAGNYDFIISWSLDDYPYEPAIRWGDLNHVVELNSNDFEIAIVTIKPETVSIYGQSDFDDELFDKVVIDMVVTATRSLDMRSYLEVYFASESLVTHSNRILAFVGDNAYSLAIGASDFEIAGYEGIYTFVFSIPENEAKSPIYAVWEFDVQHKDFRFSQDLTDPPASESTESRETSIVIPTDQPATYPDPGETIDPIKSTEFQTNFSDFLLLYVLFHATRILVIRNSWRK